MRLLSFVSTRSIKISEVDVYFLCWFMVLITPFMLTGHMYTTFNLNFLIDLDLTSSTDFEDMFIVASDVFEVMEHDRLLAMDGVSELFMARGIFSFSSTTTSIR